MLMKLYVEEFAEAEGYVNTMSEVAIHVHS